MVDFRAFSGLRPAQGFASKVAAVPYDVLNTQEAQALVAEEPYSLLGVTRPDVDLPVGCSLYSEAAYEAAQRRFQELRAEGILVESSRAFYAYAQTMKGRRQLGLMGVASAADYWADRIKKHEFTRPNKEDDRMRHIEALKAHLGPVFLSYRSSPEIDALMEEAIRGAADVDFLAPDAVRHQLWFIQGEAEIEALELAFSALPCLYIADGHHRAAAASRIGRGAPEGEPKAQFLAVSFPHDQLQILPYNRALRDLNGLSPEAFLEALNPLFEIEILTQAQAPQARHSFSLFLGERWYRLRLRPEACPDESDPVARLDVSILQEQVLAPLLGIEDPRRSERIDFVGGIRGLEELERRVRGGWALAFALYPTAIEELMAIADAGQVMPPKSTWFEPKLRSGLAISLF